MKVEDYISLYDLYDEAGKPFSVRKNNSGEIELYFSNSDTPPETMISFEELFYEYPDLDLNEVLIEGLELYDRFGLFKALEDQYFTSKTVIPFLREKFDLYRNSGGSPMYWLNSTFSHVITNYHNFRPELRGAIEKNLLEWLETWEKMEIPQPKEKPPLTLEDIIEINHLNKLVELLKEKEFVKVEESSSIKWTGIKHEQAKGRGLQFVALTDICKPLYKKNKYTEREIYKAWTKYFNFKISENMFSESKRPVPDSIYHKLFLNLINSFPYK
jgi:hypothetical protein